MLDSIPNVVIEKLKEVLSKHIGTSIELLNFSFVSGGCINQAGRLQTNRGNFFIKWNNAKKFPGMFHAEAKGLKLLASSKTIQIPEVIVYAEVGESQFLILSMVVEGSRSKSYWQLLGEQLAQIHKNSSSQFGLDHNNYIGSLTQHNNYHHNWIDFFINERINPLLKQAIDKDLCSAQIAKAFESLYKKLPSIFPDENPALLHGDLWSGNLMVDESGQPCLIDPAVYYGHREMDLAFSRLFGGFNPEFYTAYNSVFPIASDFEARVDLYNIYPLLVHSLLFGGGYMAQVMQILKRHE